MGTLIIGLALLLGVHSVRIVADDWRSQQIARFGAPAWKGTYTLISILGLVAIIWGYSQSRGEGSITLWTAPLWLHHVALSLMLLAVLFATAAYVPSNHIKAKLGHPLLIGTKTWAGAHLLANGQLADVILFGSFLVWAVLCFKAARARDVSEGRQYPHGTVVGDGLVATIGLGLWWLLGKYLHPWLIGVAVFPGT